MFHSRRCVAADCVFYALNIGFVVQTLLLSVFVILLDNNSYGERMSRHIGRAVQRWIKPNADDFLHMYIFRSFFQSYDFVLGHVPARPRQSWVSRPVASKATHNHFAGGGVRSPPLIVDQLCAEPKGSNCLLEK